MFRLWRVAFADYMYIIISHKAKGVLFEHNITLVLHGGPCTRDTNVSYQGSPDRHITISLKICIVCESN